MHVELTFTGHLVKMPLAFSHFGTMVTFTSKLELDELSECGWTVARYLTEFSPIADDEKEQTAAAAMYAETVNYLSETEFQPNTLNEVNNRFFTITVKPM